MKVLFSLLGRPFIKNPDGTSSAARYRQARYQFEGPAEKEHPVFVVALLEHLRATRRFPERVVVFGTTQSIWAALADLLLEQPTINEATILDLWDRLASEPAARELRVALDSLQEHLSRHFRALLGRESFDFRCEVIETLVSPGDQQSFLGVIHGHLQPEDRVIVDVTHGLGHQRILLAQALVALETLRGVQIESLYSGAFDLIGPDGQTPVVRLDGVLQSVRLDRAVSFALRTGDPSGLVDALDQGDPLRAPLRRLASAWRLNQPDKLRETALQVRSTLSSLSPERQAAFEALRGHLDEVILRHQGSIAAQQFAAARAALGRKNLLRAGLALREACISVGCVAKGQDPTNPGARQDPGVSDWVYNLHLKFQFDGDAQEAWPAAQSLRNALAHASAPAWDIVKIAFEDGPDAVTKLLRALIESLEAGLRSKCPGAFMSPR